MAEKRRIDLGFNPLYASLSRNDSMDQAVVFDPSTQQLFHKDFPTTDPVSASAYIGLISASAATSQTNYILMFNGTSFIPVAQGTSFQFGIDSFTISGVGDSIQQIGSGVWKSAGTLTFNATYNAGPPTEVSISLQDGISGNSFSMGTSPFATTTNPNNISYPTSVAENQVGFKLSATKSIETVSQNNNNLVDFLNFRAWGSLTNNTSLGDSNITTLSQSNAELSTNAIKDEYTFAVASGKYFAYTYRDAFTDPTMVYCGTNLNKITVAMNPGDATAATPATTQVSNYQNGNGFQENYRIIASKNTNITGHSTILDIDSSTQVRNYFYWGVAASDPATGTNIVDLKHSASYGALENNTLLAFTDTFTTERLYIAIPSRLGDKGTDYQFKDDSNGLEFSVGNNSTTPIAVTNPVGFQENYNILKSSQLLNGPITARIETI